MIDLGRFNILGIRIDAVDYAAAVDRIAKAAHERKPCAVSALAVHGLMTGALDPVHRFRLNRFDLLVPVNVRRIALVGVSGGAGAAALRMSANGTVPGGRGGAVESGRWVVRAGDARRRPSLRFGKTRLGESRDKKAYESAAAG